MPPTITFVRHAQGFHNLNFANHQIRDPLLTDLGKVQCQNLAQSFSRLSEVDLIVASPLKRTIYTALYSFPDKCKQFGIIGLPDVQETSDLPCDTGSDRPDIEKEFADKHVKLDLALLDDDWHSKKGRYSPERAAVEGRARDARRWLKARKEKHIIVVTHGAVLHYLTEDWSDAGRFQVRADRENLFPTKLTFLFRELAGQILSTGPIHSIPNPATMQLSSKHKNQSRADSQTNH